MPKNSLPSFLPNALRSVADTLAAMPQGKPSATSEAPTGEGKASPKTAEGEPVGEASMEGEAENMALNDVIILILKGGAQ